jgi:PAS domain S-box-containing protein
MIRLHENLLPKKLEDREILNKVHHSLNIADAMGGCLWLGDKYHRTIYINSVYEKLSGYSLEECIGKQSDFCFDEESKKIITEQHKLRVKGISSSYEATMVSKSGKRIPLLVSGSPTLTGGTIGIFLDLTNVKRLGRQEKISQQVLKNSTEAFVVLNKNRKIKLWTAGATKMFGHKEGEVLNKSIDIIIPPNLEDANASLIKEVDRKGHIRNVETQRMHKNGELVDVSVSVTKVMDDKKRFIGFLIIYRDITQEKRTSGELQKHFETIQDAYKELGLQKRQLDYMYEIIDAAVGSDSLETLCKLIVSALCLLTKCDGSVIRLANGDRKTLKLKACFGVTQKWLAKGQIKLENSIAEDAFKKKRAIIIDNIESNKKHQGGNLLRENKFKTMILIPLFIQDNLLGSISLYATTPAKFRLIETTFLEKMGKQCSLAICSKLKCQKA